MTVRFSSARWTAFREDRAKGLPLLGFFTSVMLSAALWIMISWAALHLLISVVHARTPPTGSDRGSIEPPTAARLQPPQPAQLPPAGWGGVQNI